MKQTKTIGNKWLLLLTVSIGSFMGLLASSMLNIAFPRLSEVFQTEPSVVLWVSVAFLLVSTGLMPVLGRIGDIHGRRRIYILGLILFTAGLILCSLAQSIIQLILFRIVQAMGSAMIVALSYAIVTASFADNERGKALGILTALMMVGPLIGPALSGFLLDTLDWRSLFYLSIPVSVIGLVMAWIFLEEQKDTNTSSNLDLWGAGTLFGTLACFLSALNLGGRLGFFSPLSLGLIISTVVLLTVFLMQEKKTAYPVVELSLFKNLSFSSGNITLFIQSIGLGAYIFLLPYYLIEGLGYSGIKTGLINAIAPLVTVVIAPLSGWLSDKIGTRILCASGMVLMSLGLFMCSGFDAASELADMLPGFVTYGVGMALFRSPNASWVMGAVTKNRLGAASALMNTIGQIGMSSGMAVLGMVFTNRQTANAIQPAQPGLDPALQQRLSLIGSFQDSIFIAAVICSIGVLTSVIRKKQ